MGKSRSVVAVACAALLMGGCASVELPDMAGETATIATFAGAAETAENLAKDYLKLANDSRKDVMWTELPILGGALVAVTAVSFGWHADYAKAAAVGAGGLTAINGFVAPRQGVRRNVQAMAAMSCVARVARQGGDVFATGDRGVTAAHLTALAQAPGLTAEEVRGLQLAAEVAEMGPHLIGSTIDSINATVLVRATDSMAAPNFDQLVETIADSTQKALTAKTGTRDVGHNATTKGKAAAAGTTALRAAEALEPADVQRAVDYAADLDKRLALCAAKAGG